MNSFRAKAVGDEKFQYFSSYDGIVRFEKFKGLASADLIFQISIDSMWRNLQPPEVFGIIPAKAKAEMPSFNEACRFVGNYSEPETILAALVANFSRRLLTAAALVADLKENV